jgi:hypothetical protein
MFFFKKNKDKNAIETFNLSQSNISVGYSQNRHGKI